MTTLYLRTANIQFYILHTSDQIIHRLCFLHQRLVTSNVYWTVHHSNS